jgi:SAM-dependent methyltransferase
MSAPAPFEPRLLRARKRRAANRGEVSFLHARAARDLVERLEAIPRRFERALSLGGQGALRAELDQKPDLAARIEWLAEADIAAGAVQLDLERMPFADGTFDLIASPLLLHWANDLAGALVQLRRALKPDGLLLASLFGAGTLQELRLCLIEAEMELTGGASPRVAPFADLQDVAHLLQRADFALPAADRDVLTVRYREPMRLFADLRAMGETAPLRERGPRMLSRRLLARACDIYSQRFSDADGRVRASFEIVTATGWASHGSQQQPLRPGSAQKRLAEALGTTERSAGEKAGR